MTDTVEDQAPASAQRSTRRGLLGLGAVLAVGAVTGEALVGSADAAEAATEAKRAHRGRQYATASLAARAARGAHSQLFAHDPKAHLLRRATFGPRPKDVKELRRLGIDRWLERQLHPSTIRDLSGTKAATFCVPASLSVHSTFAERITAFSISAWWRMAFWASR